jgi:hypothetical protein
MKWRGIVDRVIHWWTGHSRELWCPWCEIRLCEGNHKHCEHQQAQLDALN